MSATVSPTPFPAAFRSLQVGNDDVTINLRVAEVGSRSC
jgi:hypothetical protein